MKVFALLLLAALLGFAAAKSEDVKCVPAPKSTGVCLFNEGDMVPQGFDTNVADLTLIGQLDYLADNNRLPSEECLKEYARYYCTMHYPTCKVTGGDRDEDGDFLDDVEDLVKDEPYWDNDNEIKQEILMPCRESCENFNDECGLMELFSVRKPVCNLHEVYATENCGHRWETDVKPWYHNERDVNDFWHDWDDFTDKKK